MFAITDMWETLHTSSINCFGLPKTPVSCFLVKEIWVDKLASVSYILVLYHQITDRNAVLTCVHHCHVPVLQTQEWLVQQRSFMVKFRCSSLQSATQLRLTEIVLLLLLRGRNEFVCNCLYKGIIL